MMIRLTSCASERATRILEAYIASDAQHMQRCSVLWRIVLYPEHQDSPLPVTLIVFMTWKASIAFNNASLNEINLIDWLSSQIIIQDYNRPLSKAYKTEEKIIQNRRWVEMITEVITNDIRNRYHCIKNQVCLDNRQCYGRNSVHKPVF